MLESSRLLRLRGACNGFVRGLEAWWVGVCTFMRDICEIVKEDAISYSEDIGLRCYCWCYVMRLKQEWRPSFRACAGWWDEVVHIHDAIVI